MWVIYRLIEASVISRMHIKRLVSHGCSVGLLGVLLPVLGIFEPFWGDLFGVMLGGVHLVRLATFFNPFKCSRSRISVLPIWFLNWRWSLIVRKVFMRA